MANVDTRPNQTPGMSRRDLLMRGVEGIGRAAALTLVPSLLRTGAVRGAEAPVENLGTPANYEELFARMSQMAEEVGGIWAHPEAGSITRPGRAPFLPKTEQAVLDYGEENGWDTAVFNRVIMSPSDHPLDHIRAFHDAVLDFGQNRGWGDITAWDHTWVYPMMLTAGRKDIARNRQVQVMSNGEMVDIDPIRVDNWAVAANVVDRGNPKMAVYMVPWVAGEVHARLPQDTTESEVTMAFALNKHYADLKTGGNEDVVPAIIVRGVATAPVSILYGRPTDNDGGYETRVVETRLEPLTGNVTIHLPREEFKGNHAPFIAIRMPVVATNDEGETEVIFVPGSDVLPNNPKYADKHRVTEDMLRAGELVR